MRAMVFAALMVGSAIVSAEAQSWCKFATAVVVTPRTATLVPDSSPMAPNSPAPGPFIVTEARGRVLLKATKATADVDLATGQVPFLDATGKLVLAEARQPASPAPSADGKPYVAVSQQGAECRV